MPGTWFPGQVAVGGRVFNNNVIINGQTILQKGLASYPPSVTTPGTVASAGTVYNTTGYDCMVYASATTSISKVVTSAGTLSTGSGASGANLMIGGMYVPANQWISLTYTGTLTWFWAAV
jgi:hypothetical protein